MQINQFVKVTVVTICYNRVGEIRRTLDSVLSQKYQNLEYIVIDGGSTDGTKEIIQQYSDRISYWCSEPDKGIYDAMNKGIDKSTGDWICFINSGDLFYNDTVLKDIFETSYDVDILYGDVVIDYVQYGCLLKRFDKLKDSEIPLGICHQSTFMKTEMLKKYMYDVSFKIYADINSFYLMWRDGLKYHYISKPVAIFEGFGGVSSINLLRGWKESMQILNAKWYNSIIYWKSLIKVLIKKTIMFIFGKNVYDRIKYKKLEKKFIKV